MSLRDAIVIANSDPIANDYDIVLSSGATYQLTAINLSTDTDKGGDLDIYAKGQVTIRTDGNQKATIDASTLTTPNKVVEVGKVIYFLPDLNGNLTLKNIVITGGESSSFLGGGGIIINLESFGLLVDTIVENNSDSDSGGGIKNSGTLLILGSIIRNNSSRLGGGINNSGILTILDSTIANNSANSGGGIYNFETATIINSTINNNSAAGSGGGGIFNNSGTLCLNNVTVSSNTATSFGGGLFNINGSIATISNSTITNNTALEGGGIDNFGLSLNLRNTIVTGNTADEDADISGSVNDDGSNLINIDSKVSPLQNNGGPTLTHALLEGSPAIDTGKNTNINADVLDIDNDADTTELIPFDQRGSGYPRIYGNAVDIGAVEFQPPLPSINIGSASATDDLANSNATFTVTLSYASASPITVQYTTQDGSAVVGSDYVPTSGTLTFTSGQTAISIAVPIIADTLVESPETFLLTLTNPTNASIANATGTATITNLDPAQYSASNPDLIPFYGYNLYALRNHYYSNGINESRSTDNFDEYRYIASSYVGGGDLITAFGLNGAAATQHYITDGFWANRPTRAFDPARYLNSYPDLLNEYNTNTLAVTRHYITNGFSPDGRDPNLFPSDRYLASHGDLITAFASITDYAAKVEEASKHYLIAGRNESGRQITFDPFAYMTKYPDVAVAFNSDPNRATFHYITTGYGEGRRVD